MPCCPACQLRAAQLQGRVAWPRHERSHAWPSRRDYPAGKRAELHVLMPWNAGRAAEGGDGAIAGEGDLEPRFLAVQAATPQPVEVRQHVDGVARAHEQVRAPFAGIAQLFQGCADPLPVL